MKKPTVRAMSAQRNETDRWLTVYASSTEVERRRREMPAKLARLGLDARHREARLLDLCCGHGEALDCLHTLGFRHLEGMDLTITEKLATDPRFIIRQGNACATGLASESYDWITCVHSMHHLASAANVRAFLDEAWRLLKPGGRLGIIDFPASLQIKLAFWFFRQPKLHFTPYLRYFGSIIQEEWSFLQHYLPEWPQVRSAIWAGRFKVEHHSQTLFYFHVTLRKPPLPPPA